MSEMRCHCGDCGKSSFWSRSRRVKRFAQILVVVHRVDGNDGSGRRHILCSQSSSELVL